MATLGEYEAITEDPGGSHARGSMLDNVWAVTCKTCGAADFVGPGHPAVVDRGDGTHAIASRAALHAALAHSQPVCLTAGPNSDGLLDFAFSGRPVPAPPVAEVN